MDSQRPQVSAGLGATPPPTDGVSEHPISLGQSPPSANGVQAPSPLDNLTAKPEVPGGAVGLVANGSSESVPVENPITGMQAGLHNPGNLPPSGNAVGSTQALESREQLETKARVLINDINKNKAGKPPGGGSPPKKKGFNVAAAGLALTALVLMVGGGIVGIRLLSTPGTQEERVAADCPGSAVCNIPNQTEYFCKGTEVWSHFCGANFCWDASSERLERNCTDSGQVCANGQCVTPDSGSSCGGSIGQMGTNLEFHVTFCQDQPWSATAYICSNRECGNHPTYGVCHTACSSGAQAVPLGSGAVDSNDWRRTVGLSDDQIRCSLVQMDGAVGNPNLVNGFAIIDNLDNPACNPTATPPPSLTPTPPPACNSACTSNAQCGAGNICSGGRCRNPLCTAEADCICPGVTPSPTPQPLACTSIGVNNLTPNLGDTLTLTCTGVPASGLTKQFRYSYNNSATWTTLDSNANGTASLTLNQVGSYNVQCRVCRSANECSAWQTANN